MKKRSILFMASLLLTTLLSGFTKQMEPVSFRFKTGDAMLHRKEEELERLYDLIAQYKDEIATGQLPVQRNDCCAVLPTSCEHINAALIRTNCAESELIIRKGLLEKHVIKENYVISHEGDDDLIVVTMHIPVKEQEVDAEQAVMPSVSGETPPVSYSRYLYSLDLRTNLLYDVMLTPTLGVEWHINRSWGIKMDGSYTHWGSKHGRVHNLWLISPEVRRYIDHVERLCLYIGIGGNVGRYNIYKGVIGNVFFPDETGYQGRLYSGSLSMGYKLALNPSFLLDFNLGLGYTHVKYDSFTVTDRLRVYKMFKEKDVTKNLWGPTQAGVSLVWKLGSDKR